MNLFSNTILNSDLAFFASLLEEKFRDHWHKQASANKLASKLSPESFAAISNPELTSWELMQKLHPFSKKFKKELLDPPRLSCLISNCVNFSRLSPEIQSQILSSCGNHDFLQSLFTHNLVAKDSYSAVNQKLSFSYLNLPNGFLTVPFNDQTVDAVSCILSVCTRNSTSRIGKNQQKLFLTSKDQEFKAVVTLYPDLNAYFISGKLNKEIEPELESEVIKGLTEHQILNEDSLKLTTEEEYKIANHQTYTDSYKERLDSSVFFQRAFDYFKPVEEKEAEARKAWIKPLSLDTPTLFIPEVIFPFAFGCSFNTRHNLLKKLDDPTICVKVLASLKTRIQQTTDPTELEFINSLIEEDEEYFKPYTKNDEYEP